ncbi:MAG: hypothetical protein HZA20_03445 [Nitrospirae bacterium]|nr:hypothetical protein [Nitrospirota bacterium]
MVERRLPALLWDESHLWGVMAVHALRNSGLPFEIVTADDVRQGGLAGRPLLFMPGGWASKKIVALGEEGAEAVKNFVSDGGIYFGICGGAGLALSVDGGLGLVRAGRVPAKSRVPSFAGGIGVSIAAPGHPLWKGIPVATYPVAFHAWWPSQFSINDDAARVLARYGNPTPDAMSSDVPVLDVGGNAEIWRQLEDDYGILLNPARLKGEPAVIEAAFGRGHAILSLLHFDTPNDANGRRALRNIWSLAGMPCTADSQWFGSADPQGFKLFNLAAGLIETGERNLLWRWRNDYLTQWRRGVRGLEFCSLYVVAREIGRLIDRNPSGLPQLLADIGKAETLMTRFATDAARLLFMERLELQRGKMTFRDCADPEIASLRERLFSKSKSHGGEFKDLLDVLDGILLKLLR